MNEQRFRQALEQIVALSKSPVRRRLTASHNQTNGNDWMQTAKKMASVAEAALGKADHDR